MCCADANGTGAGLWFVDVRRLWTFACTFICLLGYWSCSSAAATSNNVSYAGHSVLRIWPTSNEHIDVLTFLNTHPPNQVELWTHPRVNRSLDVRVSRHVKVKVLERLKRAAIKHDVTVHDLENKIEAERLVRKRSVPDEDEIRPFNMSAYHTYEEIMDWLDQMAEECGPVCATVKVGTSYEKRELKAMRVGIPQEDKPVIWVDAGLHAREWIAPATAVHIINKLISEKETNMWVRYLLNHFVWYILPVANPDGYVYTWTTDRLWRKTRSRHPVSECLGADPNRNFGFHWGGYGTSEDPCGANFRGTAPFSEPETFAISRTLHSLSDRLSLYLTLHSYGQYWLTPWGFTYDVPEDYDDLVSLGTRATDVMQGSQFQVGAASRMLYLAAGGSDDWVKGALGVKYAYTVELGDTGEHGFLLPAQFIDKTGEDMFNALRTLALDVSRTTKRKKRSSGWSSKRSSQ